MPTINFSNPDYKDKTIYAVAGSHTETVLRELGKLSKEELENLIVNDLPSEWRLACQFIPRDEDILVEY